MFLYSYVATIQRNYGDEAIMLINLSTILLSNSHYFAYYAYRFHLAIILNFKIHDLKNDYEMLLIINKWSLNATKGHLQLYL